MVFYTSIGYNTWSAIFNIYINDLLLFKCEAQIFYFADNTTLIISDQDKSNLISKATKIMSVINK